jgi:hypothetical protein
LLPVLCVCLLFQGQAHVLHGEYCDISKPAGCVH